MAVSDPPRDSEAERRKLEEQLRQSQKLEALGQLASGIAHDFNTNLSIVFGYSDIVLDRLAADDPLREQIEQIRMAAGRLTTLTRQLLAFGRRQLIQPRRVDVNALVERLVTMLSRIIGPSISISTTLQPGVWPVNVDPGQLEQVVVNLAVNARDAMPLGGTLRISTANVRESGHATDLAPNRRGDVVKLSVIDTGAGMSAEILPRIFEPFFTTKSAGSGSGLGLSVVHGIISQSGGVISVESEPGVGSAFHVWLPRQVEIVPDVTADETGPPVAGGTETILLVEQHAEMRELLAKILRPLGYTVVEACDGQEALAVLERNPRFIHLLLTEIVLAGMNGVEIVQRARGIDPDIAAIVTTAYSAETVATLLSSFENVPLLQKPFSAVTLGRVVRKVLDAARTPGGPG